MGPNWYEREGEQIQKDYDEGQISESEYYEAMRNLNDELRGAAEEAADQAYNDTLGGW